MKFKAVSWGKWNLRVRFTRRKIRQKPIALEGFFPLSFVPESSGSRHTA